MKRTSLDRAFLPPTTDVSSLRARMRKARQGVDFLKILEGVPFDTTFDMLRSYASEMVSQGEAAKAAATLREIEVLIDPETADSAATDLHALLMQLLTALSIETDELDEAASTAASALHLLSLSPRRKDTAFLQLLGTLLHDVALLHSTRGEYKQAEREIEKSIKIFERLVKSEPDRYAAPHLMAVNGAAAIYRNRVKQAELLAHYQAATATYLELLNSGVEDVTGRLVASLADQGDTLARMGRHREAIQYYSRALKYLTRIESDFSSEQLRLSIALGESMLSVDAMRDKGVHLLNTMLHKATRINAADEHRRIVDILYKAKSRSLDILSLWYKLFPR